jgi:hypothetical protein
MMDRLLRHVERNVQRQEIEAEQDFQDRQRERARRLEEERRAHSRLRIFQHLA